MRPRTFVLLAVIVGISVSLGCREIPPVNQEIFPPPPPNAQQQMAALAYLAYLGGRIEGSDESVETKLRSCMEKAMTGQPLVAAWELTWGPAVYKFPLAELDDNMMLVVRERANPAHLAVVIRGTNAAAALDWLVEVLNVHDQVPWEYGNPPSQAKIARGIQDGLRALQTMTPAGEPKNTLKAFLGNEQSKAHSPLQIDVTGHSLGGALAPVLGLWLADTQADWDPSQQAKIAVYAFAGPTPGNTEFATYYDSRIGPDTQRLWNHLDVIQKAWNVQELETVDDLYLPVARPDAIERGLLDILQDRVKNGNYSQIKPKEKRLPGHLEPDERSFTGQLGWQHHCGYQCALGIDVPVPTSKECPSDPEPDCRPCPKGFREEWEHGRTAGSAD